MNFSDVTLTNGFWKQMYDRNADITIYAVQKQFENTGRFEALRFSHAEKPEIPIHIFFDSDVAKWMEAVAYLLQMNREKYAELEQFCDELIASMKAHQEESGYLNSYFQQVERDKMFQGRGMHELYCIGHLAEAAVAYDKATGKHTFLQVIERAMAHVNKVFIVEQSAPYATCGHEEIKIALLRLYEHTGKKLYLDMADYFVHVRGANEKDPTRGVVHWPANEYYQQDNKPAVELTEADGHAVRALYYYTAMADLAKKTEDVALKAACKRLFENITEKKMYITGGVGSCKIGECFDAAYHLPNSTAYSESCAAIALMFFCKKMLALDHHAKYSDIIERVMYNGFLSSTSLDGKAFFYENPLEINLAERDVETAILPQYRQKYPIPQRVEVFDCSCCPPNINRVLASIGAYLYTEEEDTLFIEQFAASKIKTYGVEVITDFPLNGIVTIKGSGYPFQKIAIRAPYWSEGGSICGDFKNKEAEIVNGYYMFEVGSEFELTVDFHPETKFGYANAHVFGNVGRTALTYGPVVYCLEGIDNGGTLTDLFVDTKSAITELPGEFQPLPRFSCKGVRVHSSDALYTTKRPQKEEVTLTFVPYFAFANRGEQNMQVWVLELQ